MYTHNTRHRYIRIGVFFAIVIAGILTGVVVASAASNLTYTVQSDCLGTTPNIYFVFSGMGPGVHDVFVTFRQGGQEGQRQIYPSGDPAPYNFNGTGPNDGGFSPGIVTFPEIWQDINGAQPLFDGPSSVLVSSCNSSSPPPTVGYVAMAATPDGKGYWTVESNGAVHNFGDAGNFGGMSGHRLNKPIVAMAATPDGKGYWLVGGDGGVFSFGDAHFYGSTGNIHLNKPVIGMAATPDGKGYWFCATDGGVFSYGDARFWGSMGAVRLNKPVIGMAADYVTRGYWLVAADGGIFSFHAPFHGSTGNLRLARPIVGMAASLKGSGYRFVASDGGVFDFGQPYEGSLGRTSIASPIVGMAETTTATGYWLVAADGVVYTFGGALAA